MSNRVVILGSGTSTGVPVIGCDCSVCTSTDVRNHRTRAAIFIEINEKKFLIDCGPDFRQQMLANRLHALDAVFLTHTHADHCHGIDDLRVLSFRSKKKLPFWLPAIYEEELKQRFSYIFTDSGYLGTTPQLNLKPIDEGIYHQGGVEFEMRFLPHGHMQTAAYRFGSLAYMTDFKSAPDSLIQEWRPKVNTLVVSGIRWDKEHPTHSLIPESLEIAEKLEVNKAVITHLAHNVDYNEQKRLPDWAEYGYDGLSIENCV